jgi:hypothetical protein
MRNLPELGADFTVSCPEAEDMNSPIDQIRARGNFPLVLQEELLIELKRSDLIESWRETCALARRKVDHLVIAAASRIHHALDDDEFSNPSELASDTAAFFLLALRQKGVKFPCNVPPCEVRYYQNENDGYIVVH